MVHIIFILLEIGLVYFCYAEEDIDETIRMVIFFAIEYYVIYNRLKEWIETRKLMKFRKSGVSSRERDRTYKVSIYENPKIKELADCCKMGDIVAMWELAYFFRERCEKPLQELLDTYEADPVQQNEEAIKNYLHVHNQEWGTLQAYMMWLVRAAAYGNKNANLLIENCPYYQGEAAFFYTFHTSEDSQSISIWESDSLWNMGMIDMVRGYTDCQIEFCREKGYYDFLYVESYYPPDETGFGAEWNYENAYYDEFFCLIPTDNKEMISQKLLILEQERKAYWDKLGHQASERKYKKRICSLP